MINNEGVPQAADAPINDTNISKHVEPPSKVNKKNKKKAEKASNSETVKVASELLKALIDERPELSLQFRVKAQLIEKKMTQRKLSKAVGLGGSSLSRWLNGLTAKMNTGHLFKINEM
jgi:Trp operon repressor